MITIGGKRIIILSTLMFSAGLVIGTFLMRALYPPKTEEKIKWMTKNEVVTVEKTVFVDREVVRMVAANVENNVAKTTTRREKVTKKDGTITETFTTCEFKDKSNSTTTTATAEHLMVKENSTGATKTEVQSFEKSLSGNRSAKYKIGVGLGLADSLLTSPVSSFPMREPWKYMWISAGARLGELPLWAEGTIYGRPEGYGALIGISYEF